MIHAVATKVESKRAVYQILQAQNPHQSGEKYTEDFLRAQWQQQRHFEINIKTADREKQEQQAQFHERDEALKTLASSAHSDPMYTNLKLQEIQHLQKLQDEEAEKLGSFFADSKDGQRNPEKEKSLGLLWSAKCALHKCAKDYLTKYAPDQLGLPENRAITYDEFTKLQLDDPFWNNAYLSFSKDPWAVDPTVQTGIHALLRMDRAKEELVQLTKELRRCVSWGIHLRNRLQHCIDQCVLDTCDVNLQNQLQESLGQVSYATRKILSNELELAQKEHKSLLLTWQPAVEDVLALGAIPRSTLPPEWFALVELLRQNSLVNEPTGVHVDLLLEQTVLENQDSDGESTKEDEDVTPSGVDHVLPEDDDTA
ncbi:hypothetical protein PCASD_20797 [Puccinia coronata f. sp. avenae]|uniref:CxC1-like cysteine cluster associated with KDZ transposases domain-containing protein n=1 Tax=Puccinia coronata f. sp. avenae TaxID=200324 RepID=A0A2N5TTK9_9BASI|nr:hypothetical protein PCASD_20797 [Puccinia coronata f. sp. avenae]